QDLHELTTAADEHEERAAARLVPHALSDHPAEALEAESHVDGLDGDEHLDAGGDHRPPACRARTTSPRRIRSAPRETRIRAPPTSTTISASGTALLLTRTGANRGTAACAGEIRRVGRFTAGAGGGFGAAGVSFSTPSCEI